MQLHAVRPQGPNPSTPPRNDGAGHAELGVSTELQSEDYEAAIR